MGHTWLRAPIGAALSEFVTPATSRTNPFRVWDRTTSDGAGHRPPDGHRFLMVKPAEINETSQINFVQNWFEELKARVPVN